MFFSVGGLFGTTCGTIILITLIAKSMGSMVGTVVRALAYHQCGPSSILRLSVIRRLGLLVLYSAPRVFSAGTQVFPSPQNHHLIWFVIRDFIIKFVIWIVMGRWKSSYWYLHNMLLLLSLLLLKSYSYEYGELNFSLNFTSKSKNKQESSKQTRNVLCSLHPLVKFNGKMKGEYRQLLQERWMNRVTILPC